MNVRPVPQCLEYKHSYQNYSIIRYIEYYRIVIFIFYNMCTTLRPIIELQTIHNIIVYTSVTVEIFRQKTIYEYHQ